MTYYFIFYGACHYKDGAYKGNCILGCDVV